MTVDVKKSNSSNVLSNCQYRKTGPKGLIMQRTRTTKQSLEPVELRSRLKMGHFFRAPQLSP
jgi:hypothetical protein